jgi:hypothetical protein
VSAKHDPAVALRMRAAFELFDLAERMMRETLRRESPDATGDEIEQRFRAWLQSAPPRGRGPEMRPSRRNLG